VLLSGIEDFQLTHIVLETHVVSIFSVARVLDFSKYVLSASMAKSFDCGFYSLRNP